MFGGRKKLERCLGGGGSWRGVWGEEEVGEVFGGRRKLERCLRGGGS